MVTSRSGGDGKAGRAPLRKAVLEAAHAEAACLQERERLGRQHAVGPSAVGDDELGLRQLTEAATEVVQGNGDRAGDVPGPVVFAGALEEVGRWRLE